MSHTITVVTRRPRMTSNDQRKWHWRRVSREKAAMEVEVRAAARKARLGPIRGRCDVSVIWFPPTRTHRDPDSLGPFMKASLDALVRDGVLRDDSSAFVRSTRTSIGDYSPADPRIEIHITPVTE